MTAAPGQASATAAPLDLLVVGAGPSGLATAAAAIHAGLSVLVVDRGSLCEGIRGYPTDLVFFTTRERLEIGNVPFAIPDSKPSRKQTLAYYREVARSWGVPLALHEEVVDVARHADGFAVRSVRDGRDTVRHARAVAIATGFFGLPIRLGVPGEDLPWVHPRYLEAYGHYGDEVILVGGGNSAVEAALDLYRWGARVTLVHRGGAIKPGVKYWLKPDFENRVAEGSIRALFHSSVERFADGHVHVQTPGGPQALRADAAYVLVGYLPELELARRAGVTIDPATLVPTVDPETCESDVPGFFIAGTPQAGRAINRIFIENSRDHGPRIVACLARRRGDERAASRLLAGVGAPGREAVID